MRRETDTDGLSDQCQNNAVTVVFRPVFPSTGPIHVPAFGAHAAVSCCAMRERGQGSSG